MFILDLHEMHSMPRWGYFCRAQACTCVHENANLSQDIYVEFFWVCPFQLWSSKLTQNKHIGNLHATYKQRLFTKRFRTSNSNRSSSSLYYLQWLCCFDPWLQTRRIRYIVCGTTLCVLHLEHGLKGFLYTMVNLSGWLSWHGFQRSGYRSCSYICIRVGNCMYICT